MVQTQHLDGRQPGIRENDGEYNESFVFPVEGRVAVEKRDPSLPDSQLPPPLLPVFQRL